MRILMLVLLASACVPPGAPLTPPPEPLPPADPAEYAAFGPEVADLEGQAFLTTRGGDVKVGAGELVVADPLTTLARAWFRAEGALTGAEPPRDSLFLAARRVTQSDGEGRFRLRALPVGTYLVRSAVTWEAPTGYRGALQRQGGIVAAIVEVRPDAPPVMLNQHYTRASASRLVGAAP